MSELILENGKKLPNGWTLARLGDIVLLINGRAFKPNEWSNEGLPIVRIQNLNNSDKPFNYCNFKVDEKFLIDNGQLLFAWSGTPETSFGSFIWNGGMAVLNQHIFRVEINEEFLNKKYLLYAMNQNLSKYITKAHGTAGLAHITKGMFEEGSILLPPLNEQKRIVAKIEELFSKIEFSKELLKKTKILLKQYRQSLLKSAFEGKLVSQDPNDESASVLLQRIGLKKHGSDFHMSQLITEKNILPLGWVKTCLDEICDIILGQSPPSSTYNENGNGLPFFQGKADFGDLHPIPRIWCSQPQKIAESGDVLLSVRAPVGSTNLSNQQCCIGRGLSAIRPKIEEIPSKFFLYFFMNIRQDLDAKGTGTTFKAISGQQIRSLEILLPPLNEQKKILVKIEEGFSLIQNSEKLVDSLILQNNSMKNSILKQAFEGKLVPQDPNDELAEVLLEKIKQEKQKSINQTTKPRKKNGK